MKVNFLGCYIDFCARIIVVGRGKTNVTNFRTGDFAFDCAVIAEVVRIGGDDAGVGNRDERCTYCFRDGTDFLFQSQ